MSLVEYNSSSKFFDNYQDRFSDPFLLKELHRMFYLFKKTEFRFPTLSPALCSCSIGEQEACFRPAQREREECQLW